MSSSLESSGDAPASGKIENTDAEDLHMKSASFGSDSTICPAERQELNTRMLEFLGRLPTSDTVETTEPHAPEVSIPGRSEDEPETPGGQPSTQSIPSKGYDTSRFKEPIATGKHQSSDMDTANGDRRMDTSHKSSEREAARRSRSSARDLEHFARDFPVCWPLNPKIVSLSEELLTLEFDDAGRDLKIVKERTESTMEEFGKAHPEVMDLSSEDQFEVMATILHNVHKEYDREEMERSD